MEFHAVDDLPFTTTAVWGVRGGESRIAGNRAGRGKRARQEDSSLPLQKLSMV